MERSWGYCMRLLTVAVTLVPLLLSLPTLASSLQDTYVNSYSNAHATSELQQTLSRSPFTQLGITTESISGNDVKDFDDPVFWFDRIWQEADLLQSNRQANNSYLQRPTNGTYKTSAHNTGSYNSYNAYSSYKKQHQFFSTPILSASVSISYSPSLGICCASPKSKAPLNEQKGLMVQSSLSDKQSKKNNPAVKRFGTNPRHNSNNTMNGSLRAIDPLLSIDAKLNPRTSHLARLTRDGLPTNFNQMHQYVTASGEGNSFNWQFDSQLDHYTTSTPALTDNLQQTLYWTGGGQGSWSTGEVELTIGIEFARLDQQQNAIEEFSSAKLDQYNAETLNGSVQLAYELKQGVDTYVDISKGENAGFKFSNTLSAVPLELLPSTNYRMGVTNAFMDSTLSINTALYYSNTDDRNQSQTTFSSLIDSEGAYLWNENLTNTQGFEVEGHYEMTDAIQFSLGISYTDPIYADEQTVAHLDQQLSPLWQSSASFVVEDTVPGTKWQYLVNLNFTHVGQATNDSSLNPSHTSSMMSVVSSQVGISSPSKRYNLLVWGQNMDDGDIALETNVTDPSYAKQRPRTSYGITFTAILGN